MRATLRVAIVVMVLGIGTLGATMYGMYERASAPRSLPNIGAIAGAVALVAAVVALASSGESPSSSPTIR